MKKLLSILAVAAALLYCGSSAAAQSIPVPKGVKGVPMYYEVIDGDTIYVDVIREARIVRNKRGGKYDWKKYYKLVYHFNKVYPYALVGRDLMAQVDSTIEADVTKNSERVSYINSVERELLKLFEKDIRNMTISQGMVLLRLIDRECGMSGYQIIKTYESGFAANFWQLVARIFSHNLKTRYNPKGDDWQIEELVHIWDSGQWDNFYFSIFGNLPPKATLPATSLSSVVKKKD